MQTHKHTYTPTCTESITLPTHKTQVAQPLELGVWTWTGHLQATLQTIMTPQTSPCKSIVKHKLFTPMYYNREGDLTQVFLKNYQHVQHSLS